MVGVAAARSPGTPVLFRAAAWYARRGLRVHPIRPGGKLPILAEWQRRATAELATIAEWWARWPDAGVAIATGAGSGVFVVDVDPRHGGSDSIEHLEEKHGPLPDTWVAHTPSGGRHYYYRHPGGRIGNRAGLRPGIDLRGDGGYVVAPPTELEGGSRYVWLSEFGPHETPLADPPSWLLEMIVGRGESHEGRPVDEWVALVRDGAAVGVRNDAVARLAGYLLRRRPSPRVTLELLRGWNQARCRPPLLDEEIIRTVDSIARREAATRGEGK